MARVKKEKEEVTSDKRCKHSSDACLEHTTPLVHYGIRTPGVPNRQQFCVRAILWCAAGAHLLKSSVGDASIAAERHTRTCMLVLVLHTHYITQVLYSTGIILVSQSILNSKIYVDGQLCWHLLITCKHRSANSD